MVKEKSFIDKCDGRKLGKKIRRKGSNHVYARLERASTGLQLLFCCPVLTTYK